jgi:antitoxin component YwqK of YwqJK toxin-antitoxin module
MKSCFIFIIAILVVGCHKSLPEDSLSLIQIQDRNGLTETISNPDRLQQYEVLDFTSSQPYKKVLRVYRANGKNSSKITTYHPNGTLCQYLEAKELRAHGAYREWYSNGQQKLEATVIGGTADLSASSQQDWIFDGESQVWDEYGNLIAQISYDKGVLEGVSTYFFPSGQIEKVLSFTKGTLEGEILLYSKEGFLKEKTNYKKGRKEGISLGFFDEDKIAFEEEYTEGLVRKGRYYTPQGDLISEIQNGGGFQAIYENGALTLSEFRMGHLEGLVRKMTPSGELQRSFYIKNGKKQGEETEYYLSSDLQKPSSKPLPKLSLNWSDNSIHGSVKTWYPNGKLQSQREYSHNQKSGSALAWYKEGSLMMAEEYEQDLLLSGKYFKIHKAEPVSSVVNGNGLVFLFDETGAFLKKVSYLKGKPIDPEN